MEDKWRWNHFNQLSPLEVSAISQPLKELSKVPARRHDQEYLFGEFSANSY